MTDDAQKVKDFDFADVENTPYAKDVSKEEKEKPKKESSKKKIARLEKQIATSGSLTSKMIKEARELAESKKGLDIDKFMKNNKLINVDVEQLLNASLKKDGSFA